VARRGEPPLSPDDAARFVRVYEVRVWVRVRVRLRLRLRLRLDTSRNTH